MKNTKIIGEQYNNMLKNGMYDLSKETEEVSDLELSEILDNQGEEIDIKGINNLDIPDEISYDIQATLKAKVTADEFVSSLKKVIDSYNYVELGIMDMNLRKEISNLESTKTIMDSYDNLTELNDLTKNIMSENVMDVKGIEKERETFLAEYEVYKKGYEELMEYITENYKKYEGDTKSTSFLTSQLVETINKRKTKLENDPDAIGNLEIKYLEKSMEIYSDRTNLEYIERKLKNAAAIKKLKKSYLSESRKTIRKAIHSLRGVFNQEQILAFEESMIEIFGDRFIGDLFVIHMAHLYKTEARHNDHLRIRILIMNILDIKNDIFDIGNAEEYKNTIKGFKKYYM